MYKTLHIVPDEKFTDNIFNLFEAVNSGNNHLLIITNAKKLNYTKKAPASIISTFTALWQQVEKSFVNYDIVFIHGMTNMNLFLIAKSPKPTRFVWSGWGFDYYDLITQGDNTALLKPKTKKLFDQKIKVKKNFILEKAKQFTKICLGYEDVNKIAVINNRISYFAPVIFEDYELVKKSIPDFRPQFISWNNGALDDSLTKDVIVSGENILLGNSASYENNHLDAFDIIKKIKLYKKRIIVPLSYGDMLYKEKILSLGKKSFGDNFVPLVDYLPYDQYIGAIKSCSFVIMNHLRQQAVGNIITMLYMGAKVFLDKDNPVYRHYKKQNAIIFTLEDFENQLGSNLKIQEIEKNREILRMQWCKEVILNKTRNMLDTAMLSVGK